MEKIIPFGGKYAEIIEPEKLPNPQDWAWEPDSKADVTIIRASWPGRTCTRSCNDERPDEMEGKNIFLKRL